MHKKKEKKKNTKAPQKRNREIDIQCMKRWT
jgi:hypothetical protein